MTSYEVGFIELKQWMVNAMIPVFIDWGRIFNVHVDSFDITLGNILAQLGEETLNFLVYFAI
jgi:hypothetical protein